MKFKDVLTQAITDFMVNGYDSQVKLDRWLMALKFALQEDAKQNYQIEADSKKQLTQLFERTLKSQPVQVQLITIDNLNPIMRQELDRRIRASADLIKLNRSEMIDRTLRRFQGWATSIPPGGTEISKIKVKAQIAKPLSELSFEERRVMIDQGHKMAANINYSIAANSNALGGIWHSRWRQTDYNYRQDHKERDEKFYVMRGNWAIQEGYMKSTGVDYIDEQTMPAEEVYCRCNYGYVWSLRKVPPELLTKKGKEFVGYAD